MRFFVKPQTFFNQLQWSRNHWVILAAFLGVAAFETQVSNRFQVFAAYAPLLQAKMNVSYDVALWLLTAFRLSAILLGAIAVALVIWMVGNIFGGASSKRVLFRRMAVVFTVFLGAYTVDHLAAFHPAMPLASFFLYLWGMLLGYLAIREQFSLSTLETLVVGLFAALVVSTSWHYGNHWIDATARAQVSEVAKQPGGHTNPFH